MCGVVAFHLRVEELLDTAEVNTVNMVHTSIQSALILSLHRDACCTFSGYNLKGSNVPPTLRQNITLNNVTSVNVTTQ